MWTLRSVSLALLRISLGLLMVIWGVDKLINPKHGLAVAERFYFGLGALPDLMGNVLFFPSLIIFAGVLVLFAFREDDRFALDARRAVR